MSHGIFPRWWCQLQNDNNRQEKFVALILVSCWTDLSCSFEVKHQNRWGLQFICKEPLCNVIFDMRYRGEENKCKEQKRFNSTKVRSILQLHLIISLLCYRHCWWTGDVSFSILPVSYYDLTFDKHWKSWRAVWGKVLFLKGIFRTFWWRWLKIFSLLSMGP